ANVSMSTDSSSLTCSSASPLACNLLAATSAAFGPESSGWDRVAMSATSGRDRLERRSLPVLLLLRRMPHWVLFLVVLGAVVGGLFLTGPLATALLGVVALFLGWLLLVAWPRLTEAQRLVRGLTVVVLAGAAIWRLLA
ncbi:MAG: hypothetical protein M3Q67_05310, partial [Actinomycetota bacterium]|nr:hypothetical protein [Actinomycetota bacterium]